MRKLILVPVIAFINPLFAAEQCISGNPEATNLIEQMKAAKQNSTVTQIIYKQYNIGNQQTEAATASNGCRECAAEEQKKHSDLAKIPAALESLPTAPQMLFKKACLSESGHFKADTAEVTCPEGKKAKNRNLCLTTNLLEYQNAVISSFSSCLMKSGFRTLDAASLFKLYSLESAFKPQYAYNGGVGMGQLTRIFVEDIHQKHRGLKFLTGIAKSSDETCAAAQMIAKKDIKTKPQISNTCSFTSVGDGLERNILYTLIGLATAWDKDISPKFKSYSEKYKNDPKLKEAQNLALLNGYGPGGRVAARAAVARLTHLTPEKFITAIKRPMPKQRGRSLSIYINKMEERQKMLAKEFKEPLASDYNQHGAQACVN